jgi:type I restriction enzyme S subunit
MNENGVIREGFRMTELGPLPEEWEVVRVVDCCDFERGAEPGSNSYNRQGNGIPFIRVGNISTGIQELLYTNSNNVKMCKREDILMSFDGSSGVVVKGFTGAYSSGIRKVIPKMSHMDKTFLFYALKTRFVQNTVEKYTTGITIKHASKSLPHIKIPFPSLAEQQKIAAILSAVQEAKEKTGAVINATKALKKSMMKHLFTYGPVPLLEAENIPLKETEIGMIPEDWEVVRLGDVAEDRRETVDPKKKDIAYVGLEHLTPGTIRLNNYGNSKEIKSSKSKFYKDDILYAKLRPYLDKGVLAEFEGICSTDIIVIQPNKRLINPQYLAYFIHISKFLDFATKSMTGVNHPRTSWSILKTFKIPFPPLSTQQKIASILSVIDQKIEAEENKKRALEDLFKTLLYNLMTAQIRVNHLEVEI